MATGGNQINSTAQEILFNTAGRKYDMAEAASPQCHLLTMSHQRKLAQGIYQSISPGYRESEMSGIGNLP